MSAVRVERDGDVAIVTVDRPRTKNAIDRAAMEALERVVGELEGDAELGAAILTGAGDHFVSGGDLRDLARLVNAADGRAMGLRMQSILGRWSALPCPTFAALDGDAYGGGCEIALACDHRVVAPTARLVFRQVAMGLTPGWGGGQRLLRLVGPSRALSWLTSGASVDAVTALATGLVDQVAEPGRTAREVALERARAVAAQPRAAVRAIKRALLCGAEMPLRAAIDFEAELFGQVWGSPDHRAALDAFFARGK